MHYRRSNIKGGTYFFTVNLQDRRSALLVDQIDVFRTVINQVKQRHRFKLDALVVLPEHLHALWTLPVDDHDFATRWMLIKSGFPGKSPNMKQSIPAGNQKASGVFGNVVIGNIVFGIKKIMRNTSIISITIRSSMAMLSVQWIGHFQQFMNSLKTVF